LEYRYELTPQDNNNNNNDDDDDVENMDIEIKKKQSIPLIDTKRFAIPDGKRISRCTLGESVEGGSAPSNPRSTTNKPKKSKVVDGRKSMDTSQRTTSIDLHENSEPGSKIKNFRLSTSPYSNYGDLLEDQKAQQENLGIFSRIFKLITKVIPDVPHALLQATKFAEVDANIQRRRKDNVNFGKYTFSDFHVRSCVGSFDYSMLALELQQNTEDSDDESLSYCYPIGCWHSKVQHLGVWYLNLVNLAWSPFILCFGGALWPCDYVLCHPRGFLMGIDILLECAYFLLACVARFQIAIADVKELKIWNSKDSVIVIILRDKGWWADVVSFILSSVVLYSLGDGQPCLFILTRIVRLRYLTQSHSNLLYNPEELGAIGSSHKQYLNLVSTVFLSAHLIACLLFILSASNASAQVNSGNWHAVLDQYLQNDLHYDGLLEEYVVVFEAPVWFKFYEWSFYRSVLILCSLQWPMAYSQAERLTFSIISPLATLFMSLVLSQMLTLVQSINVHDIKEQEDAQLVKTALEMLNVPAPLVERISRFHNYSCFSNNKRARHTLGASLSPRLIEEMQLVSYREIIRKAPFFQYLSAKTVLIAIIEFTESVVSPGDIVIKKGDVGKEIFFLLMGICEVCGNAEGIPLICLKKQGDYFGETALVFDVPRSLWVRARSYCRLGVLTKETFLSAIMNEPQEARQKIFDLFLVASQTQFKDNLDKQEDVDDGSDNSGSLN